jgi:hypothetical protein
MNALCDIAAALRLGKANDVPLHLCARGRVRVRVRCVCARALGSATSVALSQRKSHSSAFGDRASTSSLPIAPIAPAGAMCSADSTTRFAAERSTL